MSDWYFRRNGKLHGPFSSARLRLLALQLKIGPKTLVKKGEDGDFIQASKLTGLFKEQRQSSLLPVQQSELDLSGLAEAVAMSRRFKAVADETSVLRQERARAARELQEQKVRQQNDWRRTLFGSFVYSSTAVFQGNGPLFLLNAGAMYAATPFISSLMVLILFVKIPFLLMFASLIENVYTQFETWLSWTVGGWFIDTTIQTRYMGMPYQYGVEETMKESAIELLEEVIPTGLHFLPIKISMIYLPCALPFFLACAVADAYDIDVLTIVTQLLPAVFVTLVDQQRTATVVSLAILGLFFVTAHAFLTCIFPMAFMMRVMLKKSQALDPFTILWLCVCFSWKYAGIITYMFFTRIICYGIWVTTISQILLSHNDYVSIEHIREVTLALLKFVHGELNLRGLDFILWGFETFAQCLLIVTLFRTFWAPFEVYLQATHAWIMGTFMNKNHDAIMEVVYTLDLEKGEDQDE